MAQNKTQVTDEESNSESTYLRVDGVSADDFETANTEHDETAFHDIADRVFAALHSDYPDLFEQTTGVIPVYRPEYDPHLPGDDEVVIDRETVDVLKEAAKTLAEDIGNGRIYGSDRDETEQNAEALATAIDALDD